MLYHCRCRRLAVVFAALAGLLLALGGPTTARAQVSGNKLPDVQVIVLPDGATGRWSVALVYPRVVSRKVAQNHLDRLLALSGWKASNVEFENRGLPKNDGASRNNKGQADPPMTSVTFSSSSKIVNWDQGSLPIEPFARAFRDLKSVYVTYFVPGRFPFKGLRRHSDKQVDVVLASGGGDPAKVGYQGAFTYVLTIRDHKLQKLGLPLTQVVVPQEKVRSAQTVNQSQKMAAARRVVGYGLVGVLALVTAGSVYVWTHRFTGGAR